MSPPKLPVRAHQKTQPPRQQRVAAREADVPGTTSGNGDSEGASGGDSGRDGRGSAGNSLSDGGGGGGGGNSGAGHGGRGPTRTQGHGLGHSAGPTSVGPQRAPSVGDAAKEGTRSAPKMQKCVVESLNACGVALQQL